MCSPGGGYVHSESILDDSSEIGAITTVWLLGKCASNTLSSLGGEKVSIVALSAPVTPCSNLVLPRSSDEADVLSDEVNAGCPRVTAVETSECA